MVVTSKRSLADAYAQYKAECANGDSGTTATSTAASGHSSAKGAPPRISEYKTRSTAKVCIHNTLGYEKIDCVPQLLTKKTSSALKTPAAEMDPLFNKCIFYGSVIYHFAGELLVV